MADYPINKGIGHSVEFKGLKAQYLFIFAGAQNGRKPFEECKGRRELDCDTDGWSRYESRA